MAVTKAAERLAMFVQETTQTVYNWQYLHSLGLWTRLVCELHQDEAIQSLIYPLTQTIIGTIKYSTGFLLSFAVVSTSKLERSVWMMRHLVINDGQR